MNSMPVNPLGMTSQQVNSSQLVDRSKPSDENTFGQWLAQSIEAVNTIQQEGDDAAMKLVTGKSEDIHGTMIAMQKASISMSLMMEVRNKIISAYEEIKRMQF